MLAGLAGNPLLWKTESPGLHAFALTGTPQLLCPYVAGQGKKEHERGREGGALQSDCTPPSAPPELFILQLYLPTSALQAVVSYTNTLTHTLTPFLSPPPPSLAWCAPRKPFLLHLLPLKFNPFLLSSTPQTEGVRRPHKPTFDGRVLCLFCHSQNHFNLEYLTRTEPSDQFGVFPLHRRVSGHLIYCSSPLIPLPHRRSFNRSFTRPSWVGLFCSVCRSGCQQQQ